MSKSPDGASPVASPTPQFSVIIPLGFHREVWDECLEGWIRQTGIAGDQYELILALPCPFSPQDAAQVREKLRSSDRAIHYPFTHDMELIAAAAGEARGEFFVFTESHCIPSEDFLSSAERIFEAHPEWSAFSGHSVPVTHNLLSEVEAEMYDADIKRHLTAHPWLNVLDQCFLIRRTSYAEVGGVEAEYGHYAEWVIASRLKEAGLTVGYSAEVRIRHFYCGDLTELEEFAIDFGAGQVRYRRDYGLPGNGEGIDSPSLWENRAAINRRNARRMLAMLLRDFGSFPLKIDANRILRGFLWMSRALLGIAADSLALHCRLRKWRKATVRALAAGDRTSAAASYIELNDTACRIGQLRELRRKPPRSPDVPVKRNDSGVWLPSDDGDAILAGFEASSDSNGTRFIWSSPEAMICLPVPPGRFRIQINSPTLKNRRSAETIRFFNQGKQLDPGGIEFRNGSAAFTVELEDDGGAWLGWVAPEQRFENDGRALGLLIYSISWGRESPGIFGIRPVDLKVPVYFLHIMKSMGTAARLSIDNAFTRSELFLPEVDFYHQTEILQAKKAHTRNKILYRGHFGWGLIDALGLHPCSVITTLRDPEERILSLFDYLRRLDRTAPGGNLETFLRDEFQLSDSMIRHFLPGGIQPAMKGVAEKEVAMEAHLPVALENLRRCHLVTLQEFPEDSLLMLCHAVGAWPPEPGQKVNAGCRLSVKDTLPLPVRDLLRRLASADNRLYDEGRKLFDEHRTRTMEDLAVDPSSVTAVEEARAELRRRIRRKAEPVILRTQEWKASDPYFGSNLQSREYHRGVFLRWTGPDIETRFTWALPSKSSWWFHIQLFSATPPGHAVAATLTVNGRFVTLNAHSEGGGPIRELRAHLLPETLRESADNWHDFVLSSPVAALPGEKVRVMGLCLSGWEFREG